MTSSNTILLPLIGAVVLFALCFAVYLGFQIQRKVRRPLPAQLIDPPAGRDSAGTVYDAQRGTPVAATTEGQLFKIVILDNCCPDCGHFGFFAGPCGGLSQNIFCANIECRSGFNVTQFTPLQGVAERIGRADRKLYPTGS